MGRIRTVKLGPRIIDLDMLFYNNIVLNKEDLILPHPALTERRFVLLPLSEIAPNLIHPVFQKPIEVLLKECPDLLDVQKLSIEG